MPMGLGGMRGMPMRGFPGAPWGGPPRGGMFPPRGGAPG